MNETTRLWILRANAVWLGGTELASLLLDASGIFFGRGATAEMFAAAPHAGAAFIAKHGFGLILAVLFWRAKARRELHFAGAAAMALLGTCNLLFWSIYAAMGASTMGYVTTTVHWSFAVAQLVAAFSASGDR